MSLEMTLAGGDFLKCLTEILLVDLRDPGSHDLDERFSALEHLANDEVFILGDDDRAAFIA